MRKMTLPILLLAFAGTAFTADPATERTIALKDGGQIVVQKNGNMIHTDVKGDRARMTNDKIVMGNNALWQTISTKGTLHPNHH